MTATKTRFAPSPTGLLHIGNMRTALFNVLARGSDGKFLLRIEDTDLARSKTEYVDALRADLSWLGFDWQEGIGEGTDLGESGPYYQSKREAIYEKYYQVLMEKGLAYPCFCTDTELKVMRKLQLQAGEPPRYNGKCAHLTEAEVQAKLAAGETPVIRFRVSGFGNVTFNDLVKGEQTYQSDEIGDFIIKKQDGTASFFFANAIDDALMGVTHVLRGEDHLTNTPRQLMILQALGLREPTYGHISLITGSDGAPLSKRNGSQSIADLREAGYLPAALINYLARLGHHFENPDWQSLSDLSNTFDFEKLNKSSAKYDIEQLNYWQKESVQRLNQDDMLSWLAPHLANVNMPVTESDLIEAVGANVLLPKDCVFWAEQLFKPAFELDEKAAGFLAELGENRTAFFNKARDLLQTRGLEFKAIANDLKNEFGVKGKGLFMPLRVALTGVTFGPEMQKVLKLIGPELATSRLEKAAE